MLQSKYAWNKNNKYNNMKKILNELSFRIFAL